jgi:polyphosphate kinase
VPDREEDSITIVPVPPSLERFVRIPDEPSVILARLEEIIAANIGDLFPGSEVRGAAVFRITRNSDVAVDETDDQDLLENIRAALSQRNRSRVVRLEINSGADKFIMTFLTDYCRLKRHSVYNIDTMLDCRDLMRLVDYPGFDHLRYEEWEPQPAADLLDETDLMDTLLEHDILISLPYETFDPVVDLVRQAVDDPGTLAIKMVLYRITVDSPIVDGLIRAARNGKHVTVLVELKARFDEARNVAWARAMEDAGCDVIYGVAGLKTHAKVLLIIRREESGIRRYVHLATGNYNEKTARLYSDVGLMTTDTDLATDAAAFFNLLTGYSQPVGWKKMSVSPGGIRQRLESLIEREIQTTTPQEPGLIMAKLNSLQCPDICRALYRASIAGVRVRLNVRGICCLRPGVKGLSENIEVRSIIDRYLEHSRIFYFRNGGHEEVYLSSADWMMRNLDKRLEIMFPVTDNRLRKRLVGMLNTYMDDNAKACSLLPGGEYEPVKRKRKSTRAQEVLYRKAVDAAQSARKTDLKFRPRRKQRKEKPRA